MMKKNIFKFVLLAALCNLVFIVVHAQNNFANRHYLDPYNPEFVPGEVLIKFHDDIDIVLPDKGTATQTGISAIDKILEDKAVADIQKVFRKSERSKSRPVVRYPDGTEKQVPALYNIFKVKLDESVDILELAENISKEPEVEFAEPNYMFYTMDMEPNDALYQSDDMWHIDAVGAPAAWDSATGAGQVIAILDTGVDWDHPDLDDNIWENTGEIPDNGVDDDGNGYVDDVRGWDYINNDNEPNDDNSHGTHVAGIAAAEGNNEIGVIGIAFEAEIMPLKVLQSSGTGNSSDLAEAIEYAADNGATVINMSLGSYGESLTVKSALEVAYAYSFPVAAAGNDYQPIEVDNLFTASPTFPAAYSFVLGVQATKQEIGACCDICQPTWLACFSNYDPSGPINSNNSNFNYETKAPGVNVISTVPNGGYSIYNGTSMAAPIAAGSVALFRELMNNPSNEKISVSFIQSSLNTCLRIDSTMILELSPDLRIFSIDFQDNCVECNNNGVFEPGETINPVIQIKNFGAYADSVYLNISLQNIQDSIFIDIIDSVAVLGGISEFAVLSNNLDSLLFSIKPLVSDSRVIPIKFRIGCSNSGIISEEVFSVECSNFSYLQGLLDTTFTIGPSKKWKVVYDISFAITSSGTLIIEPGTQLILEYTLFNYGNIIANGTKDSLIVFHGPYQFEKGNYNVSYAEFRDFSATHNFRNGHFANCKFNGSTRLDGGDNLVMYDCSFGNGDVSVDINQVDSLIRCNIIGYNISLSDYTTIRHCNISNHTFNDPIYYLYVTNSLHQYNNYLLSGLSTVVRARSGIGYQYMPNNYWGTNDSTYISQRIYDFWDYSGFKLIDYEPKLTQPSDSAHGCVWKVEIEGIDPQDEVLDPLGAGTYQFDVYFNKCMDIDYTPTLSFGVRDPHTQHIVSDNASWSADSTIWTAYYDIGVETGDGINYIRVADAVDTAGFDIPVEDNERFTFVIQAAAAASVNFIATPGIGKVDLEWPPAGTEDELGYNLYRYQFVDSVNTTDSTRINQELLTDTLYTDFDVTPLETYYYFYKVLGTDMQESDRSKIVSATVDVAPNGDANGDATVNVLDITTIVAYMLNQNPQPFIFDAADVNSDDQINVLDIIGCVQIALGGKSAPLSQLINIHPDPAWIALEGDMISLESIGQVSALQFNLSCKNPESVKLFSTLDGFEFASAKSGKNTIAGILYSFSGKVIPAGTSDIIRIEGAGDIIPTLGEVTGGDANGDYVPILKKGEELILPEAFSLTAVPNPFSSQTSITFDLPETAMVKAEVMDISGKRVATLANWMYVPGRHTLTWNINQVGGLKPGIYLLHFEAGAYTKDVKLILMK